MKRFALLCLILSPWNAKAEDSQPFDLSEVRNTDSLEITVLQDWKPSPKFPDIQQKLIEITVCEWWPGQKVRLPVTLNAPIKGTPCRNLIVANQGLSAKAFFPATAERNLLRNHGVGVILIGMGTIDAMEPVGELHLRMKEHLLETRDTRYTPAWIWGMSQMRALTAAITEPEKFQPEKVLTTGGSKRGVAAAAAGIHDDRFTAIAPVVAPMISNPGSPVYVMGMEPDFIIQQTEQFFSDLEAGKLGLPDTAKEALEARAERRASQRITLQQVEEAQWSEQEIAAIHDRVWDVSRITNYLPAVRKRGLDIFYLAGTNDNVSPGLVELGKKHPDFPIGLIPGGQHGGPPATGFTTQVTKDPIAGENLIAFARHHFFDDRRMIAPPEISAAIESGKVAVSVSFPEGIEPETNILWWSKNRNKPYTLAYEYDQWKSTPLTRKARGQYEAVIPFHSEQGAFDLLSLHRHIENGIPLTVSSPYQKFIIKH